MLSTKSSILIVNEGNKMKDLFHDAINIHNQASFDVAVENTKGHKVCGHEGHF